MIIEIRDRFTSNIIISGEYENVKDCLEKNRDADLRSAYLEGAKNYRASLDVFAEMVRRQKVEVFTDMEWSAIGQIVIYRLCWDSIIKRFSAVMPHIFKILADAGFDEWLKYWEEIRK